MKKPTIPDVANNGGFTPFHTNPPENDDQFASKPFLYEQETHYYDDDEFDDISPQGKLHETEQMSDYINFLTFPSSILSILQFEEELFPIDRDSYIELIDFFSERSWWVISNAFGSVIDAELSRCKGVRIHDREAIVYFDTIVLGEFGRLALIEGELDPGYKNKADDKNEAHLAQMRKYQLIYAFLVLNRTQSRLSLLEQVRYRTLSQYNYLVEQAYIFALGMVVAHFECMDDYFIRDRGVEREQIEKAEEMFVQLAKESIGLEE